MRKILIFNRLGIGDVVLTTPLAEIIKKTITDVKIGYVVADKAKDLLIKHDYIDEVFAYNKSNKKSVISEIKSKNYNEAIIVDERLTSTLVAFKIGCKLLNKGFEITIGKKKIFKRNINNINAIDDFKSYAKLITDKVYENEVVPKIGHCDNDEKEKIDSWLSDIKTKTNKIVLVIAKTAFDNKNWSNKELAKFNHYLNEQGILPVYIGGPNDVSYIEKIPGDKLNIAGKFSMRALPYIAEAADLAVAMCTGPMHIIATTKIPIIALYGPSDPKRWAPRKAYVVQSTLECVPCLRWADCNKEQGKTCMDEISFEKVRAVIEKNELL